MGEGRNRGERRWPPVLVRIGVILLLLAAGYFWLVRWRVNPAVAESLDKIRTLAQVRAPRHILEGALSTAGWRISPSSREQIERRLSAPFLYIAEPQGGAALPEFASALEAASNGFYRARLPCEYSLVLFVLFDGQDKLIRIIEAQPMTCM